MNAVNVGITGLQEKRTMNTHHTIISHQRFTLFPGIEYSKEVFEDTQDGRQCAYVLRLCRGADIRIDAVMHPDGHFKLQEPSVSARMCRDENETLLGVVNADFFNMTNGVPQGVVVMNGNILKEEMPDNTYFFGIYQDGNPVIGDKTTFLNSKHTLKMAVGGRYVLVDEGNSPAPAIELKPDRHPRTAVCICANGDLLLVVLDGRNPGISEGMYLERFSLYLKSLGARKALNLDGGGSTVMALRMLGQQEIGIVNVPSDGFERVCANGIAVYAQHTGDGVCHSAYVTPQQEYVAPGTHLTLSAYGLDSLLGPCALPEDAVFSVPEDSGCFISETGSFVAAQSDCDVNVSVATGNHLLGTALLHVRTPDALHVPISCICAENEVHELRVAATLKGRNVVTNGTSYRFHPLGKIGWFDESGFFHANQEQCEGDILVTAKGGGPSTLMHVRVGSLPQKIDVAPNAIATANCTISCERPLFFSSRSGEQVYRVETLQAESELQFDTLIRKKPKAVGMWVHSLQGELPVFALTVYDDIKAAQSTAFETAEPSDTVWTYLEAPILHDAAQTQEMRIGISMIGAQSVQFAIDSFRLVYDYVEDDLQLPEIKRVTIKKYAGSDENERLKITAYFGVGDLSPCYAPIDYKRLRILIDEAEYTGLPGHYGVNKGAASLMLHNICVSKGVHLVRVCAQTYGGKQAWANFTFDTDQLETVH